MVSSFHETQSKRKNKRGLPDHLWVLQRALEGRSGRTERSKGAQGRILHQRPENRGALNKPGDNTPCFVKDSRGKNGVVRNKIMSSSRHTVGANKWCIEPKLAPKQAINLASLD